MSLWRERPHTGFSSHPLRGLCSWLGRGAQFSCLSTLNRTDWSQRFRNVPFLMAVTCTAGEMHCVRPCAPKPCRALKPERMGVSGEQCTAPPCQPRPAVCVGGLDVVPSPRGAGAPSSPRTFTRRPPPRAAPLPARPLLLRSCDCPRDLQGAGPHPRDEVSRPVTSPRHVPYRRFPSVRTGSRL